MYNIEALAQWHVELVFGEEQGSGADPRITQRGSNSKLSLGIYRYFIQLPRYIKL